MAEARDHQPILAEFILRLQEDAEFLLQFRNDPDKTMIEFGLDSEEIRDVIKRGDILRIRRLVRKKTDDIDSANRNTTRSINR